METLEFYNPVIANKGMNVTVRLGHKWKDIVDKGITEVEIKETGKPEVLHKAKIMTYSYLPFSMIPNSWLQLEHDPKCCDMHGLRQAMINAYGDKFDDDQMVTVLWFEVKDGTGTGKRKPGSA